MNKADEAAHTARKTQCGASARMRAKRRGNQATRARSEKRKQGEERKRELLIVNRLQVSLLIDHHQEFASELEDQPTIGTATTLFDSTQRIANVHLPPQRWLLQHHRVDSPTNSIVQRTVQ